MSKKYRQWVKEYQDQAWTVARYILKDAQEAEDATQETFARIAQRGGGACVGVRDHQQILRLVLTLAFGAQYEGSLDAIRELIESDRKSPPTWALSSR